MAWAGAVNNRQGQRFARMVDPAQSAAAARRPLQMTQPALGQWYPGHIASASQGE